MSEPQDREPTVVLQDQALRQLKGFTAVPNSVLRHGGLSYGAKLTFGVLLSYAWQDDFCWPAQERLAKDMQCSIRNVRRFLQELKAAHLIDWKQRGLNRPNVYTILPQARWARDPVQEPDRTDLSSPDRPPLTGLDRTPVAAKEDPMKNTQVNVNVDLTFRKGTEVTNVQTPSNRRWNLTEDQLDQAYALAQTIAGEIGQRENFRSYFVCAGEAIEAGKQDAVFTAISLTKEEQRACRIRTTPSQYFHHTFRRLLRGRKGRQIDRSLLL